MFERDAALMMSLGDQARAMVKEFHLSLTEEQQAEIWEFVSREELDVRDAPEWMLDGLSCLLVVGFSTLIVDMFVEADEADDEEDE